MKPLTDSKSLFRASLRGLEELARIGKLGNVNINIEDPELTPDDYKKESVEMHEQKDHKGHIVCHFKSVWYEKSFKYQSFTHKISIHLYAQLTEEEEAFYRDFKSLSEARKKDLLNSIS